MTLEEFKAVRWKSGFRAKYRNGEYSVASVNFIESLLALDDGSSDSDADWMWVRCESVELLQ